MSTEFTDLVRDSMEQFAADIRLPAGLAGRARKRHRQRRFGQCTAIVAGAAALVVIGAAVTGAAGFAGPARRSAKAGPGSGHLHALTTAYVVRQVSDALADDDLVLRDTRSASGPEGQPTYYDGQQSTQFVTWYYQGHISEYLYGLHSQPQWDAGTGLVDGKLTQVYVEYLHHQWFLIPGTMLPSPPGSACTQSDFLPATELTANWPSMIRSSLACGAYRVDGYAYIGGVKTIKVTGSIARDYPKPGGSTLGTTLFVDPATFLPVQVTQFTVVGTGPGVQYSGELAWLKATPANIAQTLVTIPAGYVQTPPGD